MCDKPGWSPHMTPDTAPNTPQIVEPDNCAASGDHELHRYLAGECRRYLSCPAHQNRAGVA